MSGKTGQCSSSLRPSTPGRGLAVPLVTTVGHGHLDVIVPLRGSSVLVLPCPTEDPALLHPTPFAQGIISVPYFLSLISKPLHKGVYVFGDSFCLQGL